MASLKIRSRMTARAGIKSLQSLTNSTTQTIAPSVIIEVDTSNVAMFVELYRDLWMIPLQVVISLISLVYLLEWRSVFAGSTLAVLFLPTFTYMLRRMGVEVSLILPAKDKRVKLVTEVLERIKAIKLYNWQGYFVQKIDQARKEELRKTAGLALSNATAMIIVALLPVSLAAVSFGTNAILNGHLATDVVFPCITFFSILSRAMLALPSVMVQYQAAIHSYNRIVRFAQTSLPRHDRTEPVFSRGMLADPPMPAIEIRKASFKIPAQDSENQKMVITDCSMQAHFGELVVITGPVGSGKSTILRGLLGQIQPHSGEVHRPDDIAFAPHHPFLMAGTVRENILFGQAFDSVWYQKVVNACGLSPDFQWLPQGDATSVGAIASVLSGGQRSRIGLARVAYSKRRVVVLDDPLSAIDARVSKEIIDQLLGSGGLLKDTVRIVATSSATLVQAADRVYHITDAKVQRQIQPSLNVKVNSVIEGHDEEEEPLRASTASGSNHDVPKLTQIPRPSPKLLPGGLTTPITEQTPLVVRDMPALPPEAGTHLRLSSVTKFIGSAKPFGWLLVFSLALLSKVLDVIGIYFLKAGTEANTSRSLFTYLLGFVVISIVSGFALFAIIMVAYHLCLLPACRVIHNRLTVAILQSKMSFFNDNLVGEILNCFTNDMNKVDSPVSGGLIKLSLTAVSLFITASILLVLLPVSIIYLLPLTYIYLRLQPFYRQACRQIRNLENQARAPILEAISEMQNGIEVIHAYGQTSMFQDRFLDAVDHHVRVWAPWQCLDPWIGMRLELLGCLIQVFSALSLVALKASPGTTGIVMNYLLQITALLSASVKIAATLEADMVSVERIETYVQNPSEDIAIDTRHREPNRPPPSWPSKPTINFHNFSAGYKIGKDLCLRDLNFTIEAGMRVAVVGRTGAGKSSLVLALMRALDGVSTGRCSSIKIDGLDISRLNIYDLRSRIFVIPQEAVAFTGSLRDNLDPLGHFTDGQIEAVVQECRLVSVLRMDLASNPLEQCLYDGGSHLSVGQMQLLSIARAILAKRNIVLLDEGLFGLFSP
ncbi:hypothetical protein ACHAQD_012169 [Fusarium lateritium]